MATAAENVEKLIRDLEAYIFEKGIIYKEAVNVKLVVTVFDFYAALFCIVSRSGLRASLS